MYDKIITVRGALTTADSSVTSDGYSDIIFASPALVLARHLGFS